MPGLYPLPKLPALNAKRPLTSYTNVRKMNQPRPGGFTHLPFSTATKTGPQPAPPIWNPSADPYMMGLTGQYNQDIAGTKARSLEEKKRILMGFGSQELARSVLGNDPYTNLISANPDTSTSSLARLGYDYRQAQQGFNEQANTNNLWYGGGRGVGLRDLAHQNLVKTADLTTAARGQLTNQDDLVAQSQREWAQKLFEGQWSAYQQWLANRGIGVQAA